MADCSALAKAWADAFLEADGLAHGSELAGDATNVLDGTIGRMATAGLPETSVAHLSGLVSKLRLADESNAEPALLCFYAETIQHALLSDGLLALIRCECGERK